MAELGGVSKGSQILYEKGKPPTADYLSLIAKAGADVLYILTGTRPSLTRSGTRSEGPDLLVEVPQSDGSVARLPIELKILNPKRRQPSGDVEAALTGELVERVVAMLTQRRPLDLPAHTEARPLDPEFTTVRVHEASVAAGPGRENGAEDVVGHLAFRSDWLRRIGVRPDRAVVARVEGDSMTPTIHHGDVVLIDTARAGVPAKLRQPKDTRPPPIYALVDDGQARVKRLELAAPGTLALLSDNPATPPDFRPLDRVSIIGRVLWWGHTNRE